MKTLPKFCVVVHTILDDQYNLEQCRIALESGAGGIFLIDHARRYMNVDITYDVIRKELPEAWIGVNYLDLHRMDAVRHVKSSMDGLWLDDVGVVDETAAAAAGLQNTRVFAGCAFKYQQQPLDLAAAAKEISSKFAVTTTSGDGTGQAPLLEKVVTIKEAIGLKPLALASGVTVENAEAFLPYVDCFMVATGVSKSFHELDPAKVRELANIINGHD